MGFVATARQQHRTMGVQLLQEMRRTLEDRLSLKWPARLGGLAVLAEDAGRRMWCQAQRLAAPFEHQIDDGPCARIADRMPAIGRIIGEIPGRQPMDGGIKVILRFRQNDLRLPLDDDKNLFFDMRMRRMG